MTRHWTLPVLVVLAGACGSWDVQTDLSTTEQPSSTTAVDAQPPSSASVSPDLPIPAGAPGAALYVEQGGETRLHTVNGDASFGGDPLTVDHAFHIASIAKPYTATIILQLHEQGVVELDDPISEWLSSDLVDQLHVIDGQSYGDQITVRHLLQHTSGLPDRSNNESFQSELVGNPTRVWQPVDLVEWTIDNMEPVGTPGADYHYADDGYVLLAMIAQEATDTSLGELYRKRIIDPLGLERTWLWGVDDTQDPIAHSYFGDLDITEDVDPSFDWGAGGVMTTTLELARFGRTLLTGELFEDPTTLDELVSPAEPDAMPLIDYGNDLFGHDGFFGSYLFIRARDELVMAITYNQGAPDVDDDEAISEILDWIGESDAVQ